MRLVAEGPERLDRFLARKLPDHSRSKLQRLIGEGLVQVGEKTAHKAGLELREGETVTVTEPVETAAHELTPVDIPLEVAYEDDDLLVVNKPRGLATHPAASLKEPTLVHALLARSHGLSQGAASYRPGIVHRLDKDTTGLILVAKTDMAHAGLASQIAEKSAVRVYVALVHGEPLDDDFTVDAPIGRHGSSPTLMAVRRAGKAAVTHVRVLQRLGDSTLVMCRLESGRTHQIRVHLSACNLPVVGDPLYGHPAHRHGPLQLHAVLLRFVHPRTGKPVSVYASPPADFMAHDHVVREKVENWAQNKRP
ncbi:MAG: RluA family pseudouridine synthase [Armatimonadetes bacterium]|nr:RluA family pseudouridine synthase [Armatimonadota bacterium]